MCVRFVPARSAGNSAVENIYNYMSYYLCRTLTQFDQKIRHWHRLTPTHTHQGEEAGDFQWRIALSIFAASSARHWNSLLRLTGKQFRPPWLREKLAKKHTGLNHAVRRHTGTRVLKPARAHSTTRAHACTDALTDTHARTHAHTRHAHTLTDTHGMHMHTPGARAHARTHARTHRRTHTQTHTHTHTHTYTHTNTHTDTHS